MRLRQVTCPQPQKRTPYKVRWDPLRSITSQTGTPERPACIRDDGTVKRAERTRVPSWNALRRLKNAKEPPPRPMTSFVSRACNPRSGVDVDWIRWLRQQNFNPRSAVLPTHQNSSQDTVTCTEGRSHHLVSLQLTLIKRRQIRAVLGISCCASLSFVNPPNGWVGLQGKLSVSGIMVCSRGHL